MKEWMVTSWRWIAVGAAMGLLTLMMALGLGSRRGTWLHGLRLSLWVIVMGLGGASAGCGDSTGIRGRADAEPDFSCVECYAAPWDPPPDAPEDPVADIEEEEFSCVECYAAPWDPGPDAPEDPVEDDPSDDEETED